MASTKNSITLPVRFDAETMALLETLSTREERNRVQQVRHMVKQQLAMESARWVVQFMAGGSYGWD